MGKKWRRNKKNKHTGGGKPRDRKEGDPSKYGQERDPYALTAGGNFKMEAFYAYQGCHNHYYDESDGIFKECTTNEEKEEERKRWLRALKRMLPASFRIGMDVHDGLREHLEKELDEYVGKRMEIILEPKGGERRIKELNLKPEVKMIAPAKKIPCIPHAYQLSLDRQTIRRNSSLKTFHEWLKVQTEAGFITRQETVSMIPPIVLDPKPHHKILDMCAAPGSKTSQLLEIVNKPAHCKDTEPTGCVIANDADSKRAYMLVHHLRRINSPASFITSCDAQFFPMLPSQEFPTEGVFDRVLCDVPCSGDGTTRKNPGIWKRWNQLNAFGLHVLQLGIALKGSRLTRVGGYICYSTCSMNPMENESVVAEILRASEGSLELVDRAKELPGLIARPGMSTWKVLSESMSNKKRKDIAKKNNAKMQARRREWEEKNQKAQVNSDDKARKQTTGEKSKEDEPMPDASQTEKKVEKETKEEQENGKEFDNKDQAAVGDQDERRSVRSQFTPSSMDEAELKLMIESIGLKEYKSFEEVPDKLKRKIRATCFPPTAEEASQFHLERCMRVMPQDMDTGGFFVALIKKVAPMNARARKRFQAMEDELHGNLSTIEGEQNEEPKVKKARIDSEYSAPVSLDKDTSGGESAVQFSSEIKSDKKEANECESGRNSHEKGTEKAHERDGSPSIQKKYSKSNGRDDFVPVPSEMFEPIKKFYGLSSESFDEGNYMIRAGGDAKVLYFITKTLHSFIDKGIQDRLTVVNSGLKGFVRNNKECEVLYRLAQEGIHFVVPHMNSKRKIAAKIDDFKKCLEAPTVQIKDFSDDFAVKVRALVMGSFAVYLEGYEDDYIKKLVIVMWRCRGDALNILVNQAEIDGLKSKIRSILHEDEPEH